MNEADKYYYGVYENYLPIYQEVTKTTINTFDGITSPILCKRSSPVQEFQKSSVGSIGSGISTKPCNFNKVSPCRITDDFDRKKANNQISRRPSDWSYRSSPTINITMSPYVSPKSSNGESQVLTELCLLKYNFLKPSIIKDDYYDINDESQKIRTMYENTSFDTSYIFNILTRRSSRQRQELARKYEIQYKAPFIKNIAAGLFEPSRTLLISLVLHGSERDAFLIHNAMSRPICDYLGLRYILITRTHGQISQINHSYKKLFRTDAYSYINRKFTDGFKSVLAYIFQYPRSESFEITDEEARELAEKIKKAANCRIRLTLDLISTLCSQNFYQLKKVFKMYSGTPFKDIMNRFRNDQYAFVLKDIYTYTQDPVGFHAKHIKKCFKHKNIYHLIRIATTRCEVDLKTIIDVYEKTYSVKIVTQIQNTFEEKYKDVVVPLQRLFGYYA